MWSAVLAIAGLATIARLSILKSIGVYLAGGALLLVPLGVLVYGWSVLG